MSAAAELLEVLAIWRGRPRLGGNEWAEKVRRLAATESSRHGKWKSAPWQRELLDAFADPLLTFLVILKAAQMGVSELVRNAIGRWAQCDPGDVLWVMTDELAAQKAMKKLQAMFRATPALRALLSPAASDSTLLELRLVNGMRVVIGWAGSPQSLASDPFRYVVLDEVAKYPESVRGEAGPVDLAGERTKTFHGRHKIILLSSPKHDEDLISREFRAVPDRRAFAIPCSSCRARQPLDWDDVRWPDGGSPATAPSVPEERLRLAEVVEREQSAWIECRGCKGRIFPRAAMLAEGAGWRQETPHPPSRSRGYHVTELAHWVTTLSDLVVKFLKAISPLKLQNFYNSSLGRGWRHEATALRPETIRARAVHPPRVVPAWATTVIATGDTQLRGWWYCLRAWGPGSRSRLLDWGFASSAEEFVARAIDVEFEVEGKPGARARTTICAIDTGGGMETPDGSRTKATYRLIAENAPVAVAIKGEGDREALQGPPTRTSRVKLTDERFGEIALELHLVNRTYWADVLASLLLKADPVLWEECLGIDEAYVAQMTSEQKVLETSEGGSRWLWKKKSRGAENHAWDLARYQVWAAERARVDDRTVPTWRSGTAVSPADVAPATENKRRWQIGRDRRR